MKEIFLKISLLLFLISALFFAPQPVFAQFKNFTECQKSGCTKCEPRPNIGPNVWVCASGTGGSIPLGPLRGLGPIGLQGQSDLSGTPALFAGVLSRIVGVLTAAAIIWFLFQFIIGAFGWIGSGGDQKAVEAARSRITNAVIGIIIVFGALVLISVIGALLGIDILNIGGFITKLTP